MNIPLISVTLAVSKWDKSKLVTAHPENISAILVTLDVLKHERSILWTPQLLNMDAMLVTLAVLNLAGSNFKLFRAEHP